MPLLLMCGLPSSGKTTVCEQLKEFITQNKPEKLPIRIISDTDNEKFSYEIYKDASKEKEQRGYLRSEVQKHLRQDQLVILDSSNYIKGFRYELFCVAKNAKTSYCVIFCDANSSDIRRLNDQKTPEKRYTEDLLEALTLRFEPPDSRNRWDNPLFTVHPSDEPLKIVEDVLACLFDGKILTPNLSTQSQPLAATNFLYELDKTCQTIVSALISEMKTAMPGDELVVPGTSTRVKMTKIWSLADLNRFKRQFINYAKMNPVEDTNKLSNMFVTFLNNMF